MRLKRLVASAVVNSPLPKLLSGLSRGCAPVFMLHRFSDPNLGVAGHDMNALRGQLAWLRKHDYHIVRLSELVRSATDGRAVRARTVALTVDDGYLDFLTTGWPALMEFDCPVTVFLVSGFIDGTERMWWDQVEFAITSMSRPAIAVRCDPSAPAERHEWRTAEERTRVIASIVERMKDLGSDTRLDSLRQLWAQTDADGPQAMPQRYAAMNWHQVQKLAGEGVEFGAHTVTHPILSRTSEAQARFEIQESWSRLKSFVPAAVKVFCYPNGRRQDFGAREIRVLAGMGFSGAVCTIPGYVTCANAQSLETRFQLPRFAWSDDAVATIQVASGIERVKAAARRALRGQTLHSVE